MVCLTRRIIAYTCQLSPKRLLVSEGRNCVGVCGAQSQGPVELPSMYLRPALQGKAYRPRYASKHDWQMRYRSVPRGLIRSQSPCLPAEPYRLACTEPNIDQRNKWKDYCEHLGWIIGACHWGVISDDNKLGNISNSRWRLPDLALGVNFSFAFRRKLIGRIAPPEENISERG